MFSPKCLPIFVRISSCHGVVVFAMNWVRHDFLKLPLFDQNEVQAEWVWRFNALRLTGNSTEPRLK